MEYEFITGNIRKDQKKSILILAAAQQLKEGKNVSFSEMLREVVDAGLGVLTPQTRPLDPDTVTP